MLFLSFSYLLQKKLPISTRSSSKFLNKNEKINKLVVPCYISSDYHSLLLLCIRYLHSFYDNKNNCIRSSWLLLPSSYHPCYRCVGGFATADSQLQMMMLPFFDNFNWREEDIQFRLHSALMLVFVLVFIVGLPSKLFQSVGRISENELIILLGVVVLNMIQCRHVLPQTVLVVGLIKAVFMVQVSFW